MSTDRDVLTSMKGTYVECENPNEMLYRFEGTLYVRDIVAPLSVDQSLLRGSVLKNTDYIYGLVVYTGHETKVLKNQVQSKQKMSFIERQLNNFMVFIVLMQCAIAAGAGLLDTFYDFAENKSFIDWIIGKPKGNLQTNSFWYFFAENFGRWFVLILNIVPISMLPLSFYLHQTLQVMQQKAMLMWVSQDLTVWKKAERMSKESW